MAEDAVNVAGLMLARFSFHGGLERIAAATHLTHLELDGVGGATMADFACLAQLPRLRTLALTPVTDRVLTLPALQFLAALPDLRHLRLLVPGTFFFVGEPEQLVRLCPRSAPSF